MHHQRWFPIVGFILAMTALMAACTPAAPVAQVSFVEPAHGSTVSSPVRIKLAAENFVVEPAGEVKAGAGHLHIIVDEDCVAAGQVIAKDATHLHYGQGQLEAQIELTSGLHTLCLQAADGAHVALPGTGMTQKINITVE